MARRSADTRKRRTLRTGLGRSVALPALVLLSAAADIACAQSAFDRSKNVGVRDRPHPEYDALGIRAGAFTLYPRLDAQLSYEDNIYATETNEIEDTILALHPQVSVESQWSRHSLSFLAETTSTFHADQSDEDTTTWRLQAAGRLDIQRDANLSGQVSFSREAEPRGSNATLLSTRSPIEFDTSAVSISGVKEFNRVRLSGRLALTDFNYQDGETFAGVNVDQDFRDRLSSLATGRVDVAINPATALFGEGSVTEIDYDTAVLVNRDSTTWRLLVGADFELTNLVTGEVAVGYVTRSFDQTGQDDASGFSYRGKVNWYPSPLITVGVSAERKIEDSGILQALSYTSDSVRLQADYELRRNLIMTGTLGGAWDTYDDVSREDSRYSGGLSATYLINRNLGVSLKYERMTQDSAGAAQGPDYTEQVFGLALVFQR
jgi:hypothetical protein